MNQGAERVIAVLSPEIEKRCSEIREMRKEKRRADIFVLLCAAAVLVPTLFVFFGLNLITLIVPAALAAVCFLLLSPILINQQGGRGYDKV